MRKTEDFSSIREYKWCSTMYFGFKVIDIDSKVNRLIRM